MTHDFKKGDPVILEDGRAGILKSLLVCIAEVEVDRHYKYVDVKTLKHNEKEIKFNEDWVKNFPFSLEPPFQIDCPKESRAGEAVAELETVTIHRGNGSLFYEGSPFNIPPDIMADGCDPEPEAEYVDTTAYEIYCEEHPDKCCPMHCCADDGPEVEILRSKP